jgi:hypothetical protein
MEVEGMWWGVLEKGQCLLDNIHYYGDYKNTSYSYTPIEDRKTDTDTETEKGKIVFGFLRQYELPLFAVAFIFGTTGNVILIIIITCHKDMRTVPNMYILNLAIGDMIILTVLFSWSLSRRFLDIRQDYDFFCTYFSFFYAMSAGLTAYSIAVLSIQRYRLTVNPIHVRVSSQPTWRATVITICGLWIVTSLFAIPAGVSQYSCGKFTLFLLEKYYHFVLIFQLFVSCVLPLCVIAFCYVMMARHLMKSSCSLSEEKQNSRQNRRKNAAKVVLGLTVTFLISYMPCHILETYVLFRMDLDVYDVEFDNAYDWLHNAADMNVILKILFSLNPCLNPIAVFCTSLAFRSQFKRYLTCCCKAKSPPTDFELTRRN